MKNGFPLTHELAIGVGGQPLSDVLAAMEANMVAHMSHLPARLPSATVVFEPDLVLVDSGGPSDTFNVVCGARLEPATADQRIAAAIDYFRAKKALFAWWVGPCSSPSDLGERLVAHGLVEAESSLGMVLDLARLTTSVSAPADLIVRRVTSPDELATYARIVAANFEPPDQGVIDFYARADVALAPDSSEHFYVGYLDGEPVSTSESFGGHGVVGVYAVTTLPHVRRRGIGTALTLMPLIEAREAGYRTATLQASSGGQGIYTRLGFRSCGTFREYKPPVAAVS